MVVNHFRILLIAILFGLLPVSAMAEEAKPVAVPVTPLEKLDAATKDMLKGLDENKAKQFSAISNSYGVIRSVEDVQQTISRAVESCGVANPDLDKPMSDRFESWKEAVRPVMKKARTKLDKMVLLQSFTQPSQVRAYLKKFDDAIVYRNQKLKPTPIHTVADCKKLQSSMDSTQDNLVRLITESLALNEDLKVKE